ncbi:hypothetical protein [Microbacterium karelineae]|uniref:hypothetical protein n=1 Tax=Microbacterium karelineae TaxID=2654283 RepID=UPI0012EA6D7D|nr:hypothetical protein [Microbacterium karelineae]
MSEDRRALPLADALLDGPRGRRLLLEFALASERLQWHADRDGSLGVAVFHAAHRLDPDRGTLFRSGARAEPPRVSPEDAATLLAKVPLVPVTSRALLLCLRRSVDMARYWQGPDGEDLLAATAPMRAALRRVAEHVAASAETAWWRSPVDERTQSAVQWEGQPPTHVPAEPLAILRAARTDDIEKEQRAARERPADPAAPFSGEWWSRPTWDIPSSTREIADGGPAGLWLVEDSLGWEAAESVHVGVPGGLRVFEIDSADAWAELCARFPLDQTFQKRHDWYQVTGRAGRWVVPDWAAVAEHYDGVHLQVGAYLAAAGTAIPVGPDDATVIAGWGPDETYWFTSRIRLVDEPQMWRLDERGTEHLWTSSGPGDPKAAEG